MLTGAELEVEDSYQCANISRRQIEVDWQEIGHEDCIWCFTMKKAKNRNELKEK